MRPSADPACRSFPTSIPALAVRRLRAPDDYPRMNEIANDQRVADGIEFYTTVEQMRNHYEHLDHTDLLRDVFLVELDGSLVGYVRAAWYDEAAVRAYEPIVFVDPAADREVVYPALFDLVNERIAELAASHPPGPKVARAEVTDAGRIVEATVRERGYRPVRTFHVMVRPTLDDLPDAPLPAGLEIRDVRPEHMETIYEAEVEAFREHWGQPAPGDNERARFFDDPVGSDTSLWRVAWEGHRVAGIVRSFIHAAQNERFGRRRGWVEHISVGRPWRGRGVARALIARELSAAARTRHDGGRARRRHAERVRGAAAVRVVRLPHGEHGARVRAHARGVTRMAASAGTRADRTGTLRAVAIVAGLALAGLEWQASPNAVRLVLGLDITVGLALVVAGVIVLRVPTARRIGLLFLAAGAAWFVGALTPLMGGLYLGFLIQILATYPTGRLSGDADRVLVAAGYAAALLGPQSGVTGIDALLVGVVAVTCMVRASSTGGPLRRGRTDAAIAAATISIAFAVIAAGLAGGSIDVAAARIGTAIVLLATTCALAIDLRWGGWSQDALASLVIDLGDHTEAITLRDRLANALDDPTLEIGYRLDDGATYVDDAGGPVELPTPGSARVAIPLTAAGVPVGVLVRDERWPVDPTLADGVAAAAELAIGNARLHAATRRHVVDLEASRARLIAAAEAERDRIRQELDGGALRRLGRVRASLETTAVLEGDREALLTQARAVIRQLEELAGGLGPASDLEDGLGPALHRLAAGLPGVVFADTAIGRLPPHVEATAYFVCSEALANVAKHARASRATVIARERNGWLIVEVVDDGVGGAAGSPGLGLEGLRQRVETTGGRLMIEDRPEGGTRLLAALPTDQLAGRLLMDRSGRTA